MRHTLRAWLAAASRWSAFVYRRPGQLAGVARLNLP